MGFGNEPSLGAADAPMTIGGTQEEISQTTKNIGLNSNPTSFNFSQAKKAAPINSTELNFTPSNFGLDQIKKAKLFAAPSSDDVMTRMPVSQSAPNAGKTPVKDMAPVIHDLIRVIQPMRQILNEITTGNNTVVRINDLINAGLVKDTSTGETIAPAPVGDFTVPPMPTGLDANGALANVILTWDDTTYENLAYTEVWRAETNDISAAVKIGSAINQSHIYVDAIGSGAERYYWIRYVSKGNIAGSFNAQAGTLGETAYDASYLLDVLAANPPPGATYNPLLYIQETDIDIGGITVPAGVYMTMAYIRDLSVTNAHIADLAVDDAKIANLDAAKITTGFLDADRIDAATITADKLDVTELSAITADLGDITAGSIRGVNINASSHTTKGSYLTSAASSGDTTLHLKNTDDFVTPSSGTYTQSGTTTVTVTTSTAHNLSVGEWIRPNIISGTAAAGIVARVSSTPGANTFTYVSSTNPTTSGSIGIPGQGSFVDTTNDSDEFTYTGKTSTSLTGCLGVLAHNNGATVLPFYKSVAINDSLNDIRIFGDRGDGFITRMVWMSGNSTSPVATFGDANALTSRDGILVFSGAGHAIAGSSQSGMGVVGTSNTNNGVQGVGQVGVQGISVIISTTAVGVQGSSDAGCGVEGSSTTGYGGRFYGNATKGNLKLPRLTSNPSDVTADQFANINGTLCYSDGTDWLRVSDNNVEGTDVFAYGAVGTYTLITNTAEPTLDDTTSLTGLSGTWRVMGYGTTLNYDLTFNSNYFTYDTLYVRIS